MDTNGQTGPALGVRGKLALGFAALLAILIFVGAESIALLSDLGGSIDVILRENYRSVIACERMKESLERMDSAALFALAGEAERGRALAARHHPKFAAELQVELDNITEPGEAELAERLRQLYGTYKPALDDYFGGARTPAEMRRIYFGRLLPVFQQIKGTADRILLLNQSSMEEADARAAGLAEDAARRMTFLLVLGTALAALSVYLLSRSILRPLGGLTRAAREIEAGNLDASVPVTSRDELGRLAATFNSMAGGLRELRRSDQARLLRARQISQQAVDQLSEAVAVFSESGEVELVNATAASVLGLRPGEPLPPQHETWISLLVNPGSGIVPGQGGRRLERDGEERIFLPRSIPLGEGTLLILEDVTERRRSDELTSDLLAAASRDLRNPLASLRAALASLRGTELNKDALDSASRDASRMAKVLDNLERITRLEERRQQLHVQAVSPRDLTQAAADEFRPSYQRHGVKLAVEEAPDLPRVLADPERVRLVLGFLLDNALSATKPGGSVTLRIDADVADGDRVRFVVTDTGCGIPEQHQGRLFERFYQVPGSEDRGRAGLGLSIARDIVQSHGGEIHLESREGEGTTVWFTLPAARQENL